jgi:hypothetical protein
VNPHRARDLILAAVAIAAIGASAGGIEATLTAGHPLPFPEVTTFSPSPAAAVPAPQLGIPAPRPAPMTRPARAMSTPARVRPAAVYRPVPVRRSPAPGTRRPCRR